MQDLHNKNIVNSQFQQQVSSSWLASKKYDIAIVGSGISCAYTLIHYISLLQSKFNPEQPKEIINVAIIDKTGEF